MNLLGMVKTQKPALDYQSLMSLSNASRVDAIRTMEQLSLRLGSSSSLFHQHRRPVSRSSSGSTKKKACRRPSENTNSDLSGERPRSRRHAEAGSSDDRTKGRSSRQRLSRKESQDSGVHNSKHRRSRITKEDPEARHDQHRISYLTASSDSTKLGEIPHRRSRLVYSSDSSQVDAYNVRPVYPLHTYMALAPKEPKEKRGFLRRVFGGKSRQEDYTY